MEATEAATGDSEAMEAAMEVATEAAMEDWEAATEVMEDTEAIQPTETTTITKIEQKMP